MNWANLVTFANILVGAGNGLAMIFLAKAGITYIMAGGNPHKQAEAYDAGFNVAKGILVLTSVAAIANVLVGNLKLG
jgi:hypothetical protein